MKTGLTISDAIVDGISVLKLSGYLDGHTFVDLERKIEGLYKAGKYQLILDLSGLTYIASAGVGAFINGQHQAKKNGGCLLLANAGQSIQEIFDILGLAAIFTVYPSVPAAVQSLKG